MTGPEIAVIGGTGFNDWPEFSIEQQISADTAWGAASAPLRIGRLDKVPCIFLPRHGDGHSLPPHQINYRANIQALADKGVQKIIAVAAVGGIREDLGPGRLAVPDQIIDYSWGRESTFWDVTSPANSGQSHVDLTRPFSDSLRGSLLSTALAEQLEIVQAGCYGVTQGPRLETAAEIQRMRQDGCDMVGMTCMPEAALACEAGIEYACIAVSVNWAAGIGNDDIHSEIEESLQRGMAAVHQLLRAVLPELIP